MKIDSRDINELRPDVRENVRSFINLMVAQGYPVGISSTYRNDEQQADLYAQGRTRSGKIVTGSKVTTFHGARLAIDIFQNIKGKEYSDTGFWTAARKILLAMGFSFLSSEMAHAQWSDGGKYSGAQVRAGNLPRLMPIYQTSLAASVSNKLGLVAGYWSDVLAGITIANGDYVRGIFVKLCRKSGKEYTDATLYAVADGILGLTSDDYWRDVITGKQKASAATMTALFKRIDAVI